MNQHNYLDDYELREFRDYVANAPDAELQRLALRMNWLAHRYSYDIEDIDDSGPRGILTLVGGK